MKNKLTQQECDVLNSGKLTLLEFLVIGAIVFFMFWIPSIISKNNAKPSPKPPEYSEAIRLKHNTVADVWRLYLDSKRIGSCAVSQTSETLIPLRIWGEAQGKHVGWDYDRRSVSMDGKRVPSPVFLILQTSYAAPSTLERYSGLRHEIVGEAQSIIIHTCAGEGWGGGGC